MMTAASVVAAGPALGQPFGTAPESENPVAVRALADVDRIAPGQTFHVAVVFTLEPKWHLYWKNPGEGALAPRIRVDGPRGFDVGRPRWPRPTALDTPLGPEYCYFDEVVLFVPVTAPPQLDDERVAFEVNVDWAVCRNVCKLGSDRSTVKVPTTSRRDQARAKADSFLARHRRRLPRSVADTPGASASFDGSVMTVTGPARGAATVTFFPGACSGVTFGEVNAVVRDDRFEVTVEVALNPANAAGPMVIDGLVALGEQPDDPCYDFEFNVVTP